MAYDFDWNGTTLAIGDEEAQTFVLPTEVTGNQQGTDSPGFLSAVTDFINFGVFNGNFRLGPPDPSLNIDVASSTSGSNFMPGWRFVQSSNTNITLKQVRDTSSPSGSNLRFTFGAGSANDEAYIEQMVDIGGSRFRQITDILRGAGVLISGANVQAALRMQYLTTDGSIAGMPAEGFTSAFATSGTVNFQYNTASSANPPGNARYLRVRVVASRSSGTSAASLDVCEVRRDPAKVSYSLADLGGGAYGSSYLHQYQGNPVVFHRDLATTNLLGWKLVPLPFMYDNIPANTTTEMLPWDNNMSLGGVPRIILPWTSYIVGMSYRISAAPSAGTINFQATIGGSNVWSPFGALGSGMVTGDAMAQSLTTDIVSAGSGVGVQMVTSAAYTPTTRHAVVVLWLAVAYDGG